LPELRNRWPRLDPVAQVGFLHFRDTPLPATQTLDELKTGKNLAPDIHALTARSCGMD
jgi:hypothetical protein